jgi:hypothetical protein
MDEKKTKKQSDKDTLAEVTKEMAKPRVAMSAREQIQDIDAMVANFNCVCL